MVFFSIEIVLHYHLGQSQIESSLEVFGKKRSHMNGILFTKRSPLVKIFRHALHDLDERGVVHRVLSGIGKNPLSREPELQVLSVGQTLFAFMLLIIGWLLVCAIMLIEKLYWKYTTLKHETKHSIYYKK